MKLAKILGRSLLAKDRERKKREARARTRDVERADEASPSVPRNLENTSVTTMSTLRTPEERLGKGSSVVNKAGGYVPTMGKEQPHQETERTFGTHGTSMETSGHQHRAPSGLASVQSAKYIPLKRPRAKRKYYRKP